MSDRPTTRTVRVVYLARFEPPLAARHYPHLGERVLVGWLLLAERTQHEAVAVARRQSADAVAQLEAQLEELSEQMASRDALADAYGVDAELAHADMQLREATAKAERESVTSRRLRDDLERMQRQHADELHLYEQRAEAARAEAAQSAQALQASESAIAQLQAQLARLSEGFNKQVEEVLSLESRLDKQKTASVDKAMARSWVVNFVEQRDSAHGDELLKLMAEWWEVGCCVTRTQPNMTSISGPASRF